MRVARGMFMEFWKILSMHRKMLVASVSALVLMTVAAFAHGGASGVVKQRMDAMSDMGKVMKTMATMMRGDSPLDASTIKTSARTILGHSGEALTKLFPENSNEKPSEALDDIWSNWAEFESLADQLKKLATGMESAAGNDLMMAGQGSSMVKGAMMGKSGMMSGGDMMAKSGVMGDGAQMPTPQMLASMPIDGVFNMVAQSCSSCHTKFRLEKK